MTATNDDALLALCAEFFEANGLIQYVNRFGTSDEKCNAAAVRWDGLVDRITHTPARSPKACKAKALVLREALRQSHTHQDIGLKFSLENRQELELAWTLVHDILGEETPWPDQDRSAAD